MIFIEIIYMKIAKEEIILVFDRNYEKIILQQRFADDPMSTQMMSPIFLEELMIESDKYRCSFLL